MTTLPLEFLQSASRTSLEDFELVSMERAAKLVKQLKGLLEQWISERVAAEVARILIENETLRSIHVDPRQESLDFTESESPGRTAAASHQKGIGTDWAAD